MVEVFFKCFITFFPQCGHDFPLPVSIPTLQDVMNKVRSDTILDMNLEKSRVKELVSVFLSLKLQMTESSKRDV